MRTFALFDANNFGFFEVYGVSARTRVVRGSASADILRKRRSIFRDFVQTSYK